MCFEGDLTSFFLYIKFLDLIEEKNVLVKVVTVLINSSLCF